MKISNKPWQETDIVWAMHNNELSTPPQSELVLQKLPSAHCLETTPWMKATIPISSSVFITWSSGTSLLLKSPGQFPCPWTIVSGILSFLFGNGKELGLNFPGQYWKREYYLFLYCLYFLLSY